MIDADKLIGKLIDGSESVINKERFVKVYELKNFYLLFISQKQIIYIHKNSYKMSLIKNGLKVNF